MIRRICHNVQDGLKSKNEQLVTLFQEREANVKNQQEQIVVYGSQVRELQMKFEVTENVFKENISRFSADLRTRDELEHELAQMRRKMLRLKKDEEKPSTQEPGSKGDVMVEQNRLLRNKLTCSCTYHLHGMHHI